MKRVLHITELKTSPRHARIALSAIFAALIVIVTLFVTGSPAALAHDKIIDNSPAAGEELEVSPESILLTFNNKPQDLQPRIQLSNADGVEQDLGPVLITDATVHAALTQPVDAGQYEVIWRVVSSDGHPIEGSFEFTVAQSPEPVPTAEPEPAPTTEQTEAAATPTAEATDPTETPTPGSTSEGNESPSGLSGILWGIVILALAAAVLTITVVRRKRTTATQNNDSE